MATFGKTTDGTNVQTFSGDRIYLSTATPSTSGTATSSWARTRLTDSGSTLMKFVVFEDNAGEPGDYLAQSDEITVNWTTVTLTEFPFSGANQFAVSSGTPYWIGLWADDPGVSSYEHKRDNNSSVNRFAGNTYSSGGTPTSPFVSGGSSNGPLNAYVEYTEAGGTRRIFNVD